MKKTFSILLLILFPILGFTCDKAGNSGIVEDNSFYFGPNDKTSSPITQEMFNKIIDQVGTIYRPMFTARHQSLNMQKDWNSGVVNAYALLQGSTAIVKIFGGIGTAGMTNNTQLLQKIIKCGLKENEKIWELPIWEEHMMSVKSQIADVANMNNNPAQTILGGAFLKHFIPANTDWVHLDIAGVSFNELPTPYRQSGATGEIMRTLVRFINDTFG